MDLIAGVIAARDEPTIPRNSPVGESQSNGLVERAVRSSKDQIRTLRLALNKRVGCRVPAKHDLMTWTVQHSGELSSKYQVNRDGKTAYEKVWGEPCKDEIVEFGEEVFYRIGEVDTGSLDARSPSGVWLGKRWKSSEHFIGTPQGVVKSYAVKRKPIEDRWNRAAIEAVVGTPWKMVPSAQDMSEPRVLPPLPADQQLRDPPKPKEAEVRAPLRPIIQKSDLSRWGFTDGCLRCRQMRSGKGEDGSKHSEKCRKRLEGEMRRGNDPRIKRAEDKYTVFEEEVMRAQESVDRTRSKDAARRGGGKEGDEGPQTEIDAQQPAEQQQQLAEPSSSSSGNSTGVVGDINIQEKQKKITYNPDEEKTE